jgi:hypothetical protein
MTVIPQSPPIKVKVTERDKHGQSTHKGIGRIVAWRIDHDGDRLDKLTPIIWTSGYAWALPYEDANVDYYDEWE